MENGSNKPVAVVVGVGPGLGAALARRFSMSYSIGILARKAEYLHELAHELRRGGSKVLDVACDVAEASEISITFQKIRAKLGETEVLLYNAGSGSFGGILEITSDEYEADWRLNALGAFVAAKEVAPAMVKSGRGVMLFTGATAGIKAGPRSVSFGRYDDWGKRTFNIDWLRFADIEEIICESLIEVVKVEVGKLISECVPTLPMEARETSVIQGSESKSLEAARMSPLFQSSKKVVTVENGDGVWNADTDGDPSAKKPTHNRIVSLTRLRPFQRRSVISILPQSILSGIATNGEDGWSFIKRIARDSASRRAPQRLRKADGWPTCRIEASRASEKAGLVSFSKESIDRPSLAVGSLSSPVA